VVANITGRPTKNCQRGYNALDVSEFKHYRINYCILFADRKNHINGIENFWNQAKRHTRKFNGIAAKHFGLFLNSARMALFNSSNPKLGLKHLKQWVDKNMR